MHEGMGHIVSRRCTCGRFGLLSGLLRRCWLCWLRLAIGGCGLFVRKWDQFGGWRGLYSTRIVAASFLDWNAPASALGVQTDVGSPALRARFGNAPECELHAARP